MRKLSGIFTPRRGSRGETDEALPAAAHTVSAPANVGAADGAGSQSASSVATLEKHGYQAAEVPRILKVCRGGKAAVDAMAAAGRARGEWIGPVAQAAAPARRTQSPRRP